MKIPSILTLSVITGLLDIIPYIGPCIAAVPIVLLTFIHNGFWAMMLVGCVFLLIQWIENYVIVPILMGKQLGVNSILIFVCALLGAVILGFWGIVLSVPLAVILAIFIDDKNNE
ncbi:AI-2E family transporter [bacterium]|nr:AI-2E family transporter [bacterium]